MIYLDTGCLVKLYYPEEDSEVIAIKTVGLQIVFTPLHNLELTSAMRLKVFRKEATEDQVLAALQFVRDDLADGGADAFVAEVEHAILMIRKYPNRWRSVAGNVRRYLVHRFPFGIYYISDCDEINIFAIMHLSRKPNYWFTRKVEE